MSELVEVLRSPDLVFISAAANPASHPSGMTCLPQHIQQNCLNHALVYFVNNESFFLA